MSVKLYLSTVSSNHEIKQHQQQIIFILQGKKISFEQIDVAASEDAKQKMREIAGNPTALPPQIANGEVYCGDFDAFEEAVECKEIEKFLKLK